MYSMEDDANALIESLPDTAQKIRQALRPQTRTPDSAIANMQAAATQIEQAAADTAAAKPPSGGVTRVQIEAPKFDVKQHLWNGTLGLVALLGQATVVGFVTFFLLASGDAFRRKMARIAGPDFAKKRITVEALDEITGPDQTLSAGAVAPQCARWGCDVARVPVDRSAARRGVGCVVRSTQSDSLFRCDRRHGRRRAGRIRAVRADRNGVDRCRRFAGHSQRRRLRADAVVDRPREQHEPGGRIRRRARVGLVVGDLGSAARACRSCWRSRRCAIASRN